MRKNDGVRRLEVSKLNFGKMHGIYLVGILMRRDVARESLQVLPTNIRK